MFYDIFIAICMSATPAPDCGQASAVDWIAISSFDRVAGLGGCQIAGMEYAAQTRLVTPGTYAKIFCRPVRVAKEGPDCRDEPRLVAGRACVVVAERYGRNDPDFPD
jgi:hypothetical protein